MKSENTLAPRTTLCLLLLAACAIAGSARPVRAADQPLDTTRSRFGFELRTRWGQVIEGNFPRFEGRVVQRPDGLRQVHIRLAAASVVVDGSERNTRFARSERFLDAARYPWVEFVSEPYAGELVQGGGPLRGTLGMHGVVRTETFVLAPSRCARPAQDCDVIARGVVSRVDYGLESWRWALADEVHFHLLVRLAPEAAP